MLSSKKLLALAMVLLVIVSAYYYSKDNKYVEIISQPIPGDSSIATIQETQEVSEVRSPDGKMKLVMEKALGKDAVSYYFSVQESETDTKNTIFSKTVPKEVIYEMSPNSWSPDNRYFFIKENKLNMINYFVFRRDGKNFSEEKQYIDVVSLFDAKNTGYLLSEATGWASPTLIYLLTRKENGERGPTYWLEIPTLAIIRLADR